MVLCTVLFIVGYTLIALEHKVNIDKAAIALFLGVLLWLQLAFLDTGLSETLTQLQDHFEEISEILFFCWEQ
jgi:hypothetical protein